MSYTAINTLGIFGALALLMLSPTGDGRLAAVIRQGDDPVLTAAMSNAILIGTAASGRVAIYQSDEPGLGWRLYKAGVLLAFNPLAASGCNSETSK